MVFKRAILCFLLLLSACTSKWARQKHSAALPGYDKSSIVYQALEARKLGVFDGESGKRLLWSDLMSQVASADIILIGEEHQDEMGHATSYALLEDTLLLWPKSTLSLEMLEKEDQKLLDQFLLNEIDQATFIDGTKSRNWAGKDSWLKWYHPLIQLAKQKKAPVIASNISRKNLKAVQNN